MLLAASCLSLSFSAANAAKTTPIQYNDVFMSYFSDNNVKAMMTYINTHKDTDNNPAPLKGFIMWEFRGDMPYNSPLSLLAAANSTAIDTKNPPLFMGYWSDWTVYSPVRMFSEAAYGVPGSIDGTTGQTLTNPDFTNKLEGMNAITYAFLEAQPNSRNSATPNAKTGTLFFFDPWSDLQNNDYTFCQENPDSCDYAMKNKPTDQKTFEANVKMGNFTAFANLKHQNPNNPLGPLKKIFSVGGYGHDLTFEDAMESPQYITNFVTSADVIMKHYGFDGIDLDYENPNMSLAQSQQFSALVNALSAKLAPEGKEIFVTILANPSYILGTKKNSSIGFAPGILSHIAQEVTGINLMTYDFHGAFDYVSDGSGKTGFLTNINQYGIDPFNVINAVNSTLSSGVPADKISLGIPAYGRALQGINKGQDGSGLNQAISNTAIPKGDLDTPDCNTDIAKIGANSCSGSFEYQFIQKNMLGKNGFTEQAWPSQVATTAYADKWVYSASPSSDYLLTLENTGSLGVIVTAKASDGSSFGPSDYIAPGKSDSYSPRTYTSTAAINGKSHISFSWLTYNGGPTGICNEALNLTNNVRVAVSVDHQGKGTCTIQQQQTNAK